MISQTSRSSALQS